MGEFPFPVVIKAASAKSKLQTITCVSLLRRLGRKRQVFEATWDERPVVAKIFAHPIKARYHAKREWRGLKLLQERGMNSPAPLFHGKSEQYGWVVVTEWIANAPTVREVWDKTTDPAKRRELLCTVSRELAKYHSKGVLQKDLHLGNFLLQKGRLFGLDPSEMRFLGGEADKRRSIWQLALLGSVVPEEDSDTIASVCRAYTDVRSWKFDSFDMAVLGKKLDKCRRAGIKKALKKCLRTSKRYQRIKEDSYGGVVARDFLEQADGCRFVGVIDDLMEKGQILKRGKTCFVSRIDMAGKDIVVKRYNHRGIIHSIRHTIKKSRALHSWLRGHRLRMLNIATPRPLAYIERRKGILVWKSYIVTEYVEGQKLSDLTEDGSGNKGQRSSTVEQVRSLLDKLAKYLITHGDLKHSNILITDDGPVLTDLDAMKVHRFERTCKSRQRRDLARFVDGVNCSHAAV